MNRLLKRIFCFILTMMIVLSSAVTTKADVYRTVPTSDINLIDSAYTTSLNQYFVVFYEGYRSGRLEMSSFDASGDVKVVWNRNLVPSKHSGVINQYKYDDNNSFSVIGTYHILSDYAEKIIASNIDIYDAKGNIIFKANAKPNQVTGVSAKSLKKKTVAVNWAASPTKVDAYQVTVATDNKFKKNKKNYTVTNSTSINLKVKKGKKYYIKVRAVRKTANGSNTYGAYSTVKKIKIK